MNKIIYLIGARASGKTTIGRSIAKNLSYSFIDTDDFIQKTAKKTIAEIVEQEGWQSFREKESAALYTVSKPNHVIATGGGMILAEQNRQLMKKNGIVLFLSASAKTLAHRLMQDPNEAQRPSIKGMAITDEVDTILKERTVLYQETADYIIDAEQHEERVIKQILTFLTNEKR